MVHTEEGTEGNLHSGHMVYTTALVEEVPNLCQLWSRGQQVVLLYKDEASMSQHAELWPCIPYWWGNQVKHLDLIHYLEHMKSCSQPGRLFMAGINLTENLHFVLIHPAWSLAPLRLCMGAGPVPGVSCQLYQHHRRRLHLGCRVCWRCHQVEADRRRVCGARQRRGCVSGTSCDVTSLNRKPPQG
ncbi:unnamed protein product [Rangifer tarandus platyrhynchus]|uniref:PI-PLC X domain-containing protein 1 n=1 Tax=Rangifer tarandus platyrhynchus TaxID=3082113 RepID=A0ABN9A1J1_RANTA|nr:unnamed protein product [Rangifer tarandus platyrhynchus]